MLTSNNKGIYPTPEWSKMTFWFFFSPKFFKAGCKIITNALVHIHSYKWCKIYIHILSHYKLGRIKNFFGERRYDFQFCLFILFGKIPWKIDFCLPTWLLCTKKMYSWMDRCVDVNLKYFTYFFYIVGISHEDLYFFHDLRD